MTALGYDPIIRDVPNHINYQISENGEVYNKITGRELKHKLGNRGYYFVGLNSKTVLIHRILAQLFIPNPENKCDVDHINRDKLNNDLSNLRWASRSENTINTVLIHSGVNESKTGKYTYWVGRIMDNKKQHVKSFPYTDEGHKLALLWRKAKEIEFKHDKIRT
jgi:hypothetical protein